MRDHLEAPVVATKVEKSREALVCTLQDELKGTLKSTLDCLEDIMSNSDPWERLKACEMVLQISKELAQDPSGAVKMTMKFSKRIKSHLPPPESLSDEQRAEVIRKTAYVPDQT